MAQAGFEHGYIYNVATGGVTTFQILEWSPLLMLLTFLIGTGMDMK